MIEVEKSFTVQTLDCEVNFILIEVRDVATNIARYQERKLMSAAMLLAFIPMVIRSWKPRPRKDKNEKMSPSYDLFSEAVPDIAHTASFHGSV